MDELLKKELKYIMSKNSRFIKHTEETLSLPLEWDGQGWHHFLLDCI